MTIYDLLLIVLVFGIPALLFLGIMVLGRQAHRRLIKESVESMGGKLLKEPQPAFGLLGFGSRRPAVYRVTYEDREGRVCRTHAEVLLGAVEWSDVVQIGQAPGKADQP